MRQTGAVSTLFSKIIAGEIPGRFVWSDDTCVAFLTIGPITDGHTLVVPRAEVDHWLDTDDDLLAHLTAVARRIGQAQQAAWEPPRVGLMVAGFEVPHLHVHVWPVYSLEDFSFARVDDNPEPAVLDANAERIRRQLRDTGHEDHVPDA